jgi:hypothetical protein
MSSSRLFSGNGVEDYSTSFAGIFISVPFMPELEISVKSGK